ncbi:AraC family transcriptional regulator [Sphingosinicellaceae bacterium]|nr:AraC family transcriptional regulator [Sphingosinicellaceae bacterium]
MTGPGALPYPVSPLSWDGISAPPLVSSKGSGSTRTLIRWWCDVDSDIVQPALDQHYLTIHLGGPKRIIRRGEGGARSVETDTGALSIVPAGAAFDWHTEGPIEFAHIYLAPSLLNRVCLEELDRDNAALCLEDRLGFRDPLLQTLFLELLEEIAGTTSASRLYVDTLLHSLQLRLLRSYANAPSAPLRQRHSIAPYRLRRVLDFMEANLAEDVALTDLAAAAGASPFHFSRAFATATGMPPYRYLLIRRTQRAKHLLSTGDGSMGDVARECGFNSAAQFSRMFKLITGTSPLKFRQR